MMLSTNFMLLFIISIVIFISCSSKPNEVVVYVSEDQIFSEPILKDFEKENGLKVRAVFDTEEAKGTGVIAVIGLLPVVAMFTKSVFGDSGLSFDFYKAVFAARRQWTLMGCSPGSFYTPGISSKREKIRLALGELRGNQVMPYTVSQR